MLSNQPSTRSVLVVVMALVCVAVTVPIRAAVNSRVLLRPVKFPTFFVTPDQVANLTWKNMGAGTHHSTSWRITNYWGRPVARGRIRKIVKGELIRIPVQVKKGYYEITFRPSDQKFGVMAIAPHQGADDPFFGIDSVMAWLVNRWHENTRNGLLEILHRSGIGISRDRLGWGHINPSPSKFSWNRVDRYGELANDYMKHGILMLQMFQDSPEWTHPNESSPYPINLAQSARSWTIIGHHFRKQWAALEIWNEPEGSIYGGRLPADQYVPIVKTISYAFARAHLHVLLGGGAFMGEDPGIFQRTCAMNGMLDQVNFVSFHDYHGPLEVEHLVRAYRRWLGSFGKSSMPLWITESGKPWPATKIGRPTRGADMASALSITMKAIEARACGIARYFPFDYPFYAEGSNNFSMVDRFHTPLRSMAAYVNCVAELSGWSFLGDLRTDHAKILLAPVFARGNQRIAVIYTGSPNPRASIDLHLHVTAIQGIDGRTLKRSASGAIPVPDGLVYLHGEASAFDRLVNTHSKANRLYQIAHEPPPVMPPHSPIILQFNPNKLDAQVSVDGYLVTKAVAEQMPVDIRIWNLSKHVHTVQLALHLPRGRKKTMELRGKPERIPAEGSVKTHWTVNLAGDLSIASYHFLSITGSETGEGQPIQKVSPLAVALKLVGSIKEYLTLYRWHARLPISDLARWQQNVAAGGNEIFSSPIAGGWCASLDFHGSGGQWAYPKFTWPSAINIRRASAILLRIRCTQPADVHLMLFNHGAAAYWTAIPIIPADGKWHVVLMPLSAFGPLNGPIDPNGLKLTDFQQIAVGLSNQSPSDTNKLEVSSMCLVGGTKRSK